MTVHHEDLPLHREHVQSLKPRSEDFEFNKDSVEKLQEIMKASKKIMDEEMKQDAASHD